jgi:hypothetical protein
MEQTIFIILMVVLGGGILYTSWLFYRNNRVFSFRLALLEKISLAANIDIKNGLEWVWRYKMFDSVTYNTMVFSFKPLKPENFYHDTAFLNAADVTENQHGNN